MEDSPHKATSSIPIEIVSDDEMAVIDAALAATRSCISLSHQLGRNARSIESITRNSRRRLSACCSKRFRNGDIEDLEDLRRSTNRSEVAGSLIHRFRRNLGLFVTDLASSEWCEKKMEFYLQYGKPRITEAMKAGKARHAKLEQEVAEKVKLPIASAEDAWAVKLMNFIISAIQLSTKGLTREVPIVGFVKGIGVVGKIDEVRMLTEETTQRLSLIETKTRSQSTIPSEPQKRNGMFQLMCYKHLWDSAIKGFPSSQFFSYFGLNPQYTLSKEIQQHCISSGFSAKTLEDLVMYFRSTCSKLPTATDQLLLRYESQGDGSLLSEEHFTYDSEWLMSQIADILGLWMGEREARYVDPEERWKCRYCQFESICPSSTITASSPPSWRTSADPSSKALTTSRAKPLL